MQNKPVPAENEISRALETEYNRLQRLYMFEKGLNLYDPLSSNQASHWLAQQPMSEALEQELAGLERQYGALQIVAVIDEAIAVSGIRSEVTSISPVVIHFSRS